MRSLRRFGLAERTPGSLRGGLVPGGRMPGGDRRAGWGFGSGRDWLSHACVLRGETCGTVNGFIVGDEAEIICNGKCMDSRRLGGAGLDRFWDEPRGEAFSGFFRRWSGTISLAGEIGARGSIATRPR